MLHKLLAARTQIIAALMLVLVAGAGYQRASHWKALFFKAELEHAVEIARVRAEAIAKNDALTLRTRAAEIELNATISHLMVERDELIDTIERTPLVVPAQPVQAGDICTPAPVIDWRTFGVQFNAAGGAASGKTGAGETGAGDATGPGNAAATAD